MIDLTNKFFEEVENTSVKTRWKAISAVARHNDDSFDRWVCLSCYGVGRVFSADYLLNPKAMTHLVNCDSFKWQPSRWIIPTQDFVIDYYRKHGDFPDVRVKIAEGNVWQADTRKLIGVVGPGEKRRFITAKPPNYCGCEWKYSEVNVPE